MTDDRYPSDWLTGLLQRAAYERAGWRCEHCGAQFPIGDTRHATLRNRDGKPRILTVHHIVDDKMDCSYENTVALCQNCHLHVQGVWQPGGVLPATWSPVPEWITARGLAYRVAGVQLALFGGDQ